MAGPAPAKQYPYVCLACGHGGLTTKFRRIRCGRCDSRRARIEEWDGWMDARLQLDARQTVAGREKLARSLDRKYREAVRSIAITADGEGMVHGNPDV